MKRPNPCKRGDPEAHAGAPQLRGRISVWLYCHMAYGPRQTVKSAWLYSSPWEGMTRGVGMFASQQLALAMIQGEKGAMREEATGTCPHGLAVEVVH